MKVVGLSVCAFVLLALSSQVRAHAVCGTAPLPLEPQGPVVTKVFQDGSDRFRARFWRVPCSESDSMLVVTMDAVTPSPYVCWVRLTLIQNALQSDEVYFAPDPQGTGGFCGDLLVPATFAIKPTPYLPESFDLDNELVIDYEGGGSAGHQQVTIPSYDPQAYGPPIPHPTRNYSGIWYYPAEAGWGLNFYQFGNTLFALWFAHDSERRAVWFQLDPQWVEDDVAAGNVLRWDGPAWGAPWDGDRDATVLGTFTLEFTAGNRATLSFNVDGVTRELQLQKIE